MQFQIHDAERLAFEHFNLTVNAKQLVSYEDLNFYLKSSDGREFILKIARSGPVEGELSMQNAIMQHLEAKALHVDLPKVLLNKNGLQMTAIFDSKGEERLARLLSWVPGRLWAKVNPRTHRLLCLLGKAVGSINTALSDFDHPNARRIDEWGLAQASWIKDKFHYIKSEAHREIALYFFQIYEKEILPKLKDFRMQVCHNDANDYNILVNHNLSDPDIQGAIDFGDSLYTHTINELAICAAYCINEQPDPLSAAAQIVKGFHEIVPLEEKELDVLFGLIATRVLVSVTSAAINKIEHPNNEYLQINVNPGWELLERWHIIPPEFAHFAFRNACGLEPCPKRTNFNHWKTNNPLSLPDLFGHDFDKNRITHLDLSVGSTALGNNSNFHSIEKFKKTIDYILAEADAEVGIGGYGEIRPFYTTDVYQVEGNSGPQWRTVHLGLDVWMPSGTPVLVPEDGIIHSFQNNAGERNYGPTIILEHKVSGSLTFFTLYGHLSESSLKGLRKGQIFKKGQRLATIGPAPENGNWPPHLHFQIMLDMMNWQGDFPGVAFPNEKEIWLSLCPSINESLSPDADVALVRELLESRNALLSQNLSLSFKTPLHIVRGYMQYLYDETGRRYLDTNNNVPHVGHQHPRVVKAARKQTGVLNTNTRYLHGTIIRYAEELLATFPSELCVCHFVNSGSEANELALRMAKTFSGQKDMIAVEYGYHGNTGGCIDISSYKFDGKGGQGAPSGTHIVPIPDRYRGLYRRDDPQVGHKYAKHIQQAINTVKKEGRGIAGFICESILSCGGQIVLPEGYLKEAYRYVRNAGGLCIADEVQVGFGRVGDAFWAFELQGVIPDIVTMGKPIGNGHPLAAVVTTRAVADAFANGMEYFNTFGGNPVSCAIGREVLQIIKDENLQEQARVVGCFLLEELKKLQQLYPIIGDIRGHGLFLGIELVQNRETLQPATEAAAYLANRMKENGVLVSTDGPFDNVIKIKPPLCFQITHAHFFLEKLEKLLREDFLIS